MNEKTEKLYKEHLKRVKEKYGFFPKDFEKSLKCIYEAFESVDLI